MLVGVRHPSDMPETVHRVDRPRPGPDWGVREVTRRTEWEATEEACACCGAAVDLGGPHVGMDLTRLPPERPPASEKLHFERVRYVFCDVGCAERWRVHESA